MSSDKLIEHQQGPAVTPAVKRLTDIFFLACNVGFPLLGVWLVVALIVPFNFASIDKILNAKLTFTSLGLMFSIFQVFLGVLLAMIGISTTYDVDAAVGPAKVKLASASPGILLIITGNIIFGFSLIREFEVTEKTIKVAPKIQNGTAGNTTPANNVDVKGP